ncbi:hypothetical protein [Cryobacterium sp. BB736]|uniref:hypothetical protein n=1 Tax=Cryobacterium sp. BB736 TaxID=2746963 RepID=UPI001875E670|nr:hypothetical protein [Cryobacterium sp. BB736]
MEQTTIEGYGCVVSWDGNTLRAKGTNKFTHRALMGQNRDLKESDIDGMTSKEVVSAVMTIPDELTLTRGQFTVEKFRLGNPVTNGNLMLRTDDGVKYELHFRRKSNADFEKLVGALRG